MTEAEAIAMFKTIARMRSEKNLVIMKTISPNGAITIALRLYDILTDTLPAGENYVWDDETKEMRRDHMPVTRRPLYGS